MTKREALRKMAELNMVLFNDTLKTLEETAENVVMGEEHLSGNDEILDAGEGKHWEGFGARFIEIKRSYATERTDSVEIEFYDKER
jgi:hypothetical protein